MIFQELLSNGHLKSDIENYTFDQCYMFIENIERLRRRYSADLATAVSLRFFDEKGWKEYVKDL